MFTGEDDINIWENRVEDYLDDTRKLDKSENISFKVRVAHDLFDCHDFDEVSLKSRVDFERFEREQTMIRELLEDEKTG